MSVVLVVRGLTFNGFLAAKTVELRGEIVPPGSPQLLSMGFADGCHIVLENVHFWKTWSGTNERGLRRSFPPPGPPLGGASAAAPLLKIPPLDSLRVSEPRTTTLLEAKAKGSW